jgi:pimeloyl-ACP methyl ester carboxylesterase
MQGELFPKLTLGSHREGMMDKSPHESGFVSVNGINLHYLDWGGSSDVLLFLAGLGCNAHNFDDFAPRFSDTFHVMALTRRGHGESDYPETGYDIDTLTEDIRQFLDALEIEQVILAGHSMAGVELSHF